jgi:hypothetical protein
VEAAIGIEPMNKGFAEIGYLFARVPICSLVTIFVGVSDIPSVCLIAQIQACWDL